MGFIWFALAAMIGLVVGSVLRSATASRQVARGRKRVRKELASEIDHLRARHGVGRSAGATVYRSNLSRWAPIWLGLSFWRGLFDGDDVVFEAMREQKRPVHRNVILPDVPSNHRCLVVALPMTSRQSLALGLRLNGCVMV